MRDNNEFRNYENKERKSISEENLVNKDEFYTDEENSYYIEKIEKLKKKSKRKNKIFLAAISCMSIFTFSGGMILDNYLNKKNMEKNQQLNYKINDYKYNNEKNEQIIEKEDSNKKFKEEKEKLSIEEIVKIVSPSVVTISVTSNKDMFKESQSLGTGFIVDENGTVVTNYHVIDGAREISITLNNGKEVKGKIIATNKKDDLAILDIIDEIKMPGIAKLEEKDEVNAGQEIIAIGNPLGKEFSGSVTKGIVSAPKRIVNMNGFNKEFIQIDAAINPGNSGGPLINLKGEIIGVNTAKKSGENVEGIGFAVPIKQVKEMLGNIENYKDEMPQYEDKIEKYKEYFEKNNPNNQYNEDYYREEVPNEQYPEYEPNNEYSKENPNIGEEYKKAIEMPRARKIK